MKMGSKHIIFQITVSKSKYRTGKGLPNTKIGTPYLYKPVGGINLAHI